MTLEEKALEYSSRINGFTKEDCYNEKGELFQFIKSDIDIYLAGARELEKENAELKTNYKVLSCSVGDWGELQDKYEKEQRKNNELSDQLAQAKEIIKNLLSSKTDFDERRFALWAWKEDVNKAEQFLKEVVK